MQPKFKVVTSRTQGYVFAEILAIAVAHRPDQQVLCLCLTKEAAKDVVGYIKASEAYRCI